MSNKPAFKFEEDVDLRRGPWTLEEDSLLVHYITCHGEGRWNHLARSSGLKRTGKSCRLRWLNYLKPDVKRGNLTPEEQILILELHSKWGNRWSRIAQQLPGRTDNEIKNYWRTRVQKQARQLNVDANSPVFRNALRCFWSPRLAGKSEPSPPSINDLAKNLNPYHHQEAPSSAPQAMFCDVNPWCDLYFSPETMAADGTQGFLPTPSNTSGLGSAAAVNPAPELGSAAPYGGADNAVGDGYWSIDELWEVRKLQKWGI
ncbi:unnamed protein product [Spirodela intermedia]|uniref:Uncharacterized protein n=2 Tax=Spirodela intermedia TaxID=51605 RepID=A0A7I8LK28_SPIIN|nr:unnamed protein product [Spirodela intermedia]CAA6673207.1 unnamed protein product [Spirodela intermedia]CAA7410431.1 unnamed protein product [Spirodela intermedia]